MAIVFVVNHKMIEGFHRRVSTFFLTYVFSLTIMLTVAMKGTENRTFSSRMAGLILWLTRP